MSRLHLQSLRLYPFGSHRDTTLRFAAPGTLGVIYGPNGAGKSTLRRAIHHFLFGIPQGRLDDDYRFGRSELRLEAALQLDGEPLRLARVRGARNSLRDLDADDAVVDPARLAAALALDRDAYLSRFCLDHAGLRAGGQALLEAPPGELASLGLATLRRLRLLEQQLGEEAATIFKPTGRTPPLNSTLNDYKQYQSALNKARLSARDWQRAEQAVRDLEAEHAALEAELSGLRAEGRRLDRIRRVRPLLAEYHELEARLTALAEVPELPEDFHHRRIELLAARDRVQLGLERERAALAQLEARLEALPAPAAVLAQAQAIGDCTEKRGEYRQALRELPVAELTLRQARAQRGDAAARAGLAADAPLPALPEAALERLTALAGGYRPLLDDLEQAAAASAAAQARLAELTAQTQTAAPDAASRQAMEEALRASAGLDGELEALAAAELALAQAAERLERGRRRLGPPLDAAREFPAARVPGRTVIEDYQQRLTGLAHERQTLARQRLELEAELAQRRRERAELCEQGAPPELAQLQTVRGERDRYWAQLRGHLVLGDQVPLPLADPQLPAAFEDLVGEADTLADRRYAEADRLQQLAQLQRAAAELEQRLGQLQRSDRLVAEGEAALAAEWQGLWQAAGFAEVEPPAAMRVWRDDYEQALAAHADWERAAQERARWSQRLRRQRELLVAACEAAGAPAGEADAAELRRRLGRLQAQAADLAERQREEELALRQATEAARGAAEQEARARRRLEDWRGQWQAALGDLRLAEGLVVEQALGQVKALRALAAADAEAGRGATARARLRSIVDAFEGEVRALAQALLEQPPADVERQLDALAAALRAADETERQRRGLEEERTRLRAEVERQLAAQEAQRAMQQAMLTEAGVQAVEELEQAERRAAEKRHSREQAERLRRQLFELGDGVGPEALAAEAAAEPAEGLAERLQQLEQQAAAVAERQTAVNRALGEAQEGLKRLAEGDAEPLAQQQDAALLRLRELAERYAVRQVAAGLVRNAIEAYAEDHQDPLLAGASVHLQRITGGVFAGVRADYGEQDEVVHLALRGDGERVPVAGLSDGERDALYLALYVTALEQQLDAGNVLPVVFDDVLINVDDPRSRPILELLAELAGRTQVLLFTHHERVVELAQRVSGAQVCRLGAADAEPA